MVETPQDSRWQHRVIRTGEGRTPVRIELSGLTRQEIMVIKACAPDAKSFESVAATLVEQYSGVHLREGRSLGQPDLRKSGHLRTRSGKPSG